MYTRRPAITPPANRRGRLTAFLLTFFLAGFGVFRATGAFAQQQQPPISPSTQPASPNAPRQSEPQETYKIQSQVNLVVLHTSVLNDRGVFVPGLKEENFRVLEDKVEQKLSVFKQEDVPVSFGLVIDNSGSMRDKRPQVNAAALTFVKTSNSQDEGFVVNFNDDYYLDTEHDFTSDLEEMKTALERIDARGSTALYDALIGSVDHLKKGARDKKVILIVTDGEDNASRESLEQAVRRLEEKNGPTIYTIGLLGEEHSKRARRALRQMAEDTGGVAFFPKDLSEVQAITSQIAHDIRNQYTIQYKPSMPQSVGGYRTVKVEAQAHGYKKLQVRTRSGYYAGQQRPSVTDQGGTK